MNEKKRIKRKLITMQNLYGKEKGKLAWVAWKGTQKNDKKNG
jgi:hypothetical protein